MKSLLRFILLLILSDTAVKGSVKEVCNINCVEISC
jgi:hypothetical protein